jgi:hypothetical protein
MHVLRLAIFYLSENVLVVDNWGGLPEFIKHGGMFDRCLCLVPLSLVFVLAFGLLLSDCGDIIAE